MKIGIFDSGIGGFTVMDEIVKTMPGKHEYIYFGDNANNPYGEKTPGQLRRFARRIVKFLLEHKVDIIVVACNTMVAVAMATMKDVSTVPVIGVIAPTVAHLATRKRTTRVAIAATTATTKNGLYRKSLAEHGITTVNIACPLFEPLIEAGQKGQTLDEAIDHHLKPLVGTNIDALVLGCTHYPIIQDRIRAYLDANGMSHVELIDPAIHTAKYVKKRFKNAPESDEQKFTILFS